MRKRMVILIVAFGLALASCSGNNAEQLFETAKLEELQDNREHAKKLYQDIVNRYPDSSYAQEAKARLAALDAM